ncbi:MAG TPA: hypothetical protein VF600_16870 [Abditibacteriaceae bacterium]
MELCDIRSGATLRTLYAPHEVSGPGGSSISPGPFRELHFSPNGRVLTGISWNGDMALLDTQSGKCISLRMADFNPTNTKYSHLRHLFIGFSRDSAQLLFTEQWGKRTTTHTEESEKQALHRANIITVATDTGALMSRVPLALPRGEWPDRTALTPDGRTLVCSTRLGTETSSYGRGGKIILFDARSGQRLRVLQQGFSETISLACSPVEPLVAVSWKGLISKPDGAQFFDLRLNQSTTIQTGPNERPNNFTFSSDGKLVAGLSGERICLWNTRTGQLTQDLGKVSPWVSGLRFSPNGNTLASSGDTVAQIRRIR